MAVYISLLILTYITCTKAVTIYVRGAGASFPATVYKSWINQYSAFRSNYMDLSMTYDAIGSGGGKARIKKPVAELDVEYAGSDSLLKDNEYDAYPGLRMFPTMAGAVVIGYNLPGVPSLVLSREHIVGIYNGTYNWWNDTSIQTLNPNITLPQQPILVLARRDKSGTTEIFTKALCSFSPDWKTQYGYFSVGLDQDENSVHWNSSVVSLYGQTNRGLSGLLLTFRYSIAYLSVADAVEANIPYAMIKNKGGNVVLPDTTNVQKAMDERATGFTQRLTVDLVDADDPVAYPISAYTYMIVRMDSFLQCDTATELYRYIEWSLTDSDAGKLCSELLMVPLSQTVTTKIQNDILNNMYCGGKAVSELVKDQKYQEWLQTQTWRVPTFVTAPLVFLLIVAMLTFLVYQQVKINRAIWKKEYFIPEASIKMLSSFNLGKSVVSVASRKSTNSVHMTTSGKTSASSSSESRWTKTMMQLAIYDEKEVCLRNITLRTPHDLKTNTKRRLLNFRDKIHHLNVLEFFGITSIDHQCYLVSGSCKKGILKDILQNDKFSLDVNFKYSISGDVAAGMEYLHYMDFIHSNLSSSVCYIDSRWTVKIADWEYLQILEGQNDKHLNVEGLKSSEDIDDENVRARQKYWKDPHLLINPGTQPTKSADIYSFSIILVEIFTREDPYDELCFQLEPKDVIEKIIIKDIRPVLPDELSTKLKKLISECWQMPPNNRPYFPQIVKKLNRIKPSKKSVLDCMMEAVETYAVQLEEKVEERTRELAHAMNKTEELLHQMLPPSVAAKLAKGEAIEPESVESVTIFFSDIVGFTSLSSRSSPLEIVKLLNDLYITLDNVIDKHEVYKVETIGDAYMVISGLPKRCTKHASNVADMAIDFAVESIQFKIHHMPKERLKLRAGIHSGPVAAGVVGLKMPRYCLFGDTVNTASRMESTSVANKVQVSETTHSDLCLDNYILHPRGEIAVKGKGSMKTFWLHGKSDSSTGQMPPEFLRIDTDGII